LAYALREFPAGGSPAKRTVLLNKLVEMQTLIGTLRVHVNNPGAEVFLDNASVGIAATLAEVFVEPGHHVLEARHLGLPPQSARIAINKGEAMDVDLKFPDNATRKTVIATGVSVAAASAIVGAVFTGLAVGKMGTINNLRTTIGAVGCGSANAPPLPGSNCADLQSAINDHATFGNIGFWTLAGAGVVGVGTVVYALTSKPSAPVQAPQWAYRSSP
jgi:hypothetical protein